MAEEAKKDSPSESPKSKWGGTRIKNDNGSDRSISSKEHNRQQLQDDISSFISKGGQVNTVAANVTADPPKEPISKYGNRPL